MSLALPELQFRIEESNNFSPLMPATVAHGKGNDFRALVLDRKSNEVCLFDTANVVHKNIALHLQRTRTSFHSPVAAAVYSRRPSHVLSYH
jgi:hypothetical protein